jgi:hypothetical protein
MTKKKQPIPSPSERKKITFYENEKTQADLRIRLKYDDMNQSEFFRAIIQGYLEQDTRIASFIDEYKENYEIQGKPRRRKSRILRDKGQETKNKFALDKEMIENIFDLLEKEHPDI